MHSWLYACTHLMASKSWLTLILLFLTWRESVHCNGLTVDPPEDLVISDLGRLGRLQITWSPPASLSKMTADCLINMTELYQLEYFDTYSNSWTTVGMADRKYIAQFDLMKDVRVKAYTLLSGPCTNGTMIKSTSYTELIQKPPSTGVVGTAAQDFVCVYHNRKNVECKWRRSPKTPTDSRQTLFFWHKKLEQAEECPKYLISNGIESGCNFTGNSFPEFTDINFCVNGSSPEGPLKPLFISLQIQNYVKPETAEKLHLQTGPDKQLQLHWDGPVGRVPAHCLEWEVEHSQEGPDREMTSEQISTKQRSLTLPATHGSERNCLRVRSKMSKYCADKGFWSEWSHSACHPASDAVKIRSFGEQDEEKKEVVLEPGRDTVPVYVYIAAAIIATLVLLCVVAVLILRRSRHVKKLDSLITTFFTRSPVLTVTEA